MKLKLSVIPLILVFLFSGCRSNNETAINLRSISFSADITYYNENYSADCLIDGEGNFVALITQPESIYGLSVEYTNGNCKIKYNDIEVENSQSLLPVNCAFDVIYNILKDCENTIVEADDENLKLTGEYVGFKYHLTAAPTGLPISLTISDMGISVDFKNVSYII